MASLFEPTRNALVPVLVGSDRLTAANGLMGFNSSAARLVGSSLGGLVLGTSGLDWVLAGYLAALLLATALLLPRFRTVTGPAAVPIRQPMFRAWLDGLAEFRRERSLRVTGMTLALGAVAQGMFLVLFSAVGAPAVFGTSGALTVVQTTVTADRTGRVLATTFAEMAAFQTAGTLAAGALVDVWGLGWLLNIQATLLLVAGVVAVAGLRRRAVMRRSTRDATETQSATAARP
ncbi:hypothetical protein ABZ863_04145 [Saccharomonospora sp. NPDC046836]|uniref:hypothetical protein n=1 Tax=Saccharomonospora sp. NPDC046836 TaxID=3156921 RepID=UPI0033F1C8C8